MSRYGVRQAPSIVNAGNRGQNFLRNLLVELDVLIKLLSHCTTQCFDFALLMSTVLRFDRCHDRREVRLFILNLLDMRALLPFNQHLHSTVGQFEHLQDGGHTAHLKHIFCSRLILGSGFLCHQHDAAVTFHSQLQSLDALGPPHEQRNHHMRKHHDIAQRQQWQVQLGGRQRGLSRHRYPRFLSGRWSAYRCISTPEHKLVLSIKGIAFSFQAAKRPSSALCPPEHHQAFLAASR